MVWSWMKSCEKLLFVKYRCCHTLLCLSFLLGFGEIGFTQTEQTNPFSWQPIPEKAYQTADNPYLTNEFVYLESERNEQTELVYRAKTPHIPALDDSWKCLVVTPPGGIQEVRISKAMICTSTGETIASSSDERLSKPEKWITTRMLGEFRGAEIHQVLLHPEQVESPTQPLASWLREATFSLTTQPRNSTRKISPLFQEAFQAVVMNPTQLESCLPSTGWIMEATAPELNQTMLRIETQEEGWHQISVSIVEAVFGQGMRGNSLKLRCKAPLIAVPEECRGESDPRYPEDQPISLFLMNQNNELIPKETKLDSTQKLVFYAEPSQTPEDPNKVYWLSQSNEKEEPFPPLSASTEIEADTPVATCPLTKVIGEDRVFVNGGKKTFEQDLFWVDREIPVEATEPIQIALPGWCRDHPHRIDGKLRLLFASSSKRDYIVGARIRQPEISLLVDEATLPFSVDKAPDDYAQQISFQLPGKINIPQLEIRYTPATRIPLTLYLDNLTLETTQDLVWAATDVVYRFVEAASCNIQVKRIDDHGSMPWTMGETISGVWERLKAESSSDSLNIQLEHPIRKLSLMTGKNWKKPQRIQPWQPPSWLKSQPEVEQLILSPSQFERGSRRIAQANSKAGHPALWIDTQDIYNLFSGGQFSSHAIRDFLNWTAWSWDPAPSVCLLVGDSSWDSYGRFPHSSQVPRWTPSFHTAANPDFPNDLWYYEGRRGDLIGDWLWGRIPCQNEQQMEDYLRKRELFDREPNGEWSQRWMWVSDDNYPFEDNMVRLCESILPLGMRLVHLFVRDYPFIDNFYYGKNLARVQAEAQKDPSPLDYGKISPQANEALRNNLNQGVSLFVYHGHSGLNVLAHERILFGGGSPYSDIPTLRNQGKCPLMFLMTCDVGRFNYAEIQKWSLGLAEELLVTPGGGALGIVASTGRGLPTDHILLLHGCLEGIFHKHLRHAGSIFWVGKIYCILSPNQGDEANEMFTYLGDPLFMPRVDHADLAIVPKSCCWKQDGSLDLRLQVPIETNPNERAQGWLLDDSWREVLHWKDIKRDETGTFEIRIDDARPLQNIHLGFEMTAFPELPEKTTKQGQLSLKAASLGAPDWAKVIGSDSPNLTISADQISFETYSPKSGDTLFIQARVRNDGKGIARQVSVEARQAGETKPLSSFSEGPKPMIPFLFPGEEKAVRIRWDMWKSEGDYDLTVVVDPANLIDEITEEDNQATRRIRVLKPADLGWGVVRDSTREAVDFKRARSVAQDWILKSETADLGLWEGFRSNLQYTDRGALLPLPLSNFGEVASETTTLKFSFRTDPGRLSPIADVKVAVPPIPASLGQVRGTRVPVLLIPGITGVEVVIDADHVLDENNRENNRLYFEVPESFWNSLPSFRGRRVVPQALQNQGSP